MLSRKHFLSTVFLFLSTVFIRAQDDTAIIRLTLDQIIDSTLNNHPEIKNAGLKVVSAKAGQLNIPGIKPTDISYVQGQKFSSLIDRDFEIHQNIGSPLSWIQQAKYNKNMVALNERELQLIKMQLINKVKAAYYMCIFEMNRVVMLNKQKGRLDEISNSTFIHFHESNDSLSEKTIVEIQFYEIQNQIDISYNDYLLAKNSLLQAAYINTDVDPADEELKMYEVAASNDTSYRAAGNLIKSYYKQLCSVSTSKLKLENSKYFPEITFGYFNQSINRKKGYTGWLVGAAIPLWFFPQYSNSRVSRIQKEISENELEQQKFNIEKNSEHLIIELNKYFERLNYFYNYALNKATMLEENAVAQLKSGTATFGDYFNSISTAYKIRLNYLETLNKYNQTAIELELYTY